MPLNPDSLQSKQDKSAFCFRYSSILSGLEVQEKERTFITAEKILHKISILRQLIHDTP